MKKKYYIVGSSGRSYEVTALEYKQHLKDIYLTCFTENETGDRHYDRITMESEDEPFRNNL